MKILSRNEFINEVYIPTLEKKEYEELQKINEGLLKTIFGTIKGLFTKDWETIKCNNKDLIAIYKEMDDGLTGFAMMKLSKKDQCNKIRQELVNFAYTWYEHKMSIAKDKDEDPKIAKSMKFKNDTLKEELESCKTKIKNIADGDSQMIKWAQILMEDMKSVINQSIRNEIKDEETKKQIEDEKKKRKENREKLNKKAEELQGKQLKEVEDERKKLISNVEATPMDNPSLLGDKAIQNLAGEFKKIITDKSKMKEAVQSDSSLGLKKIFSDEDIDAEDGKNFKKSLKIMEVFYAALADNKVMEKFKSTPAASVQAMCIAVNGFIKYCIYGGQDYSEVLPIMAKCAIISNGVISYNLPLNDETDPKKIGNYFTDILEIISSGKLCKGKVKINGTEFQNNGKTLMSKILDEAEKMKKDATKKYDDEMKNFKLELKNDNTEI